MRGGPGTSDPERIAYMNVPLVSILMAAFDVGLIQIDGPGWIKTEKYDLMATMSSGVTRTEMQEMLRSLIAERFHLMAHEETRNIDGYELSISKTGSKLKPHQETGSEERVPPWFRNLNAAAQNLVLTGGALTTRTRDYLARRGGTVAQLADSLRGLIFNGAPVVDHTGLVGEYDYYVEFAPPQLNATDADEPGPDIFAAFQEQLGLRLEQKKIPMRTVVVDRAERVPEAN